MRDMTVIRQWQWKKSIWILEHWWLYLVCVCVCNVCQFSIQWNSIKVHYVSQWRNESAAKDMKKTTQFSAIFAFYFTSNISPKLFVFFCSPSFVFVLFSLNLWVWRLPKRPTTSIHLYIYKVNSQETQFEFAIKLIGLPLLTNSPTSIVCRPPKHSIEMCVRNEIECNIQMLNTMRTPHIHSAWDSLKSLVSLFCLMKNNYFYVQITCKTRVLFCRFLWVWMCIWNKMCTVHSVLSCVVKMRFDSK